MDKSEWDAQSKSDRTMKWKESLIGLLRQIDPAIAVFIGALCMVGVAYGMAAVRFDLFPYTMAEDAIVAAQALGAIEDDGLMTGLIEMDADAPSRPQVERISAAAGDELLLVTGGFGEYLSECPTWGCLAWVIDRTGKVIYKWEVDFDGLFGDLDRKIKGRRKTMNMYPVGLAPTGDGGLYVSFHGRNTFPYQIGIARISSSGDIVWKNFDHAHHWITTGPDGKVYAPSMTILNAPEQFGETTVRVRCDRNVYNEGVRVYSPTGEMLKEYSILDLYGKSGLPGLYYSVQNDCDPVHLNSVDVATASIAAGNSLIDEGDILVSIREPSAIALISPKTGTIKAIHVGRTAAQHSANFLPDGDAIIFDNKGGLRELGGTRMVRMDISTGAVETIYPNRADQPFVPVISGDGGQIDVNKDGTRALMSLKDQARVIEVDLATGDPVWTMTFAFDFSSFLEHENIKAQASTGYFRPYGVYYIDPETFGLPELTARARAAQ